MWSKFSALLLVLWVWACEAPAPTPEEPRVLPDVAACIRQASVVAEVSAAEVRMIAPGVSETDLTLRLSTGFPERVFIVAADMRREELFLSLALPSYILIPPAGAWPRAIPTNMAARLNTPENRVLAMVNGGFWNTKTFTPRGPVHMDGNRLWTVFDPAWGTQGLSFVAYTEDRQVLIDKSETYAQVADSCPEMSGAGLMLVWDGAVVDNSFRPETDREPRTAIGYTADGFLFLFCVDGRDAGVSEGMNYADMSSIFAALGCWRAVNVDGGGSTQMLVRNPDTGSFEIRNKPSDGEQRAVVDAWAIVAR
ncbi:MAG: phosphodiester glycosidase family protein [Bacteroidales bacterium]|nr:phosphodiester glycosidase family protein [Bacteroidales bacterium]